MENRICVHPDCQTSAVIECEECKVHVCLLHGCKRCYKCYKCTQLAKKVHYFCIPCRKKVGCIYRDCGGILIRFCTSCGDKICTKHSCEACGRCKDCSHQHLGEPPCDLCLAKITCSFTGWDDDDEPCANYVTCSCDTCDEKLCSDHKCTNCSQCTNCCECIKCSISDCEEYSTESCQCCRKRICSAHRCENCYMGPNCCKCASCQRCGKPFYSDGSSSTHCTDCRIEIGCCYKECDGYFQRNCSQCGDNVCVGHSCDSCGRCDECIHERKGATCNNCWTKQSCVYTNCNNNVVGLCRQCNDSICQRHLCSACAKCLECCKCDRCDGCGDINPRRCYCGNCMCCYGDGGGECNTCSTRDDD